MNAPIDPHKFRHPRLTAKGETRAYVDFKTLQTLWFNTGSLCNIECANCYIESSPTADHFVYLSAKDMAPYLDEIESLGYGPVEIAFTGGEPYMNPEILRLSEMALERGHNLLVLTNAMKPLMRPRIQTGLRALNAAYPRKMALRVSLDHFSAKEHDNERGAGGFDIAVRGMDWISAQSIPMHIAGRAMFSESEAEARKGYERLIESRGWNIDAFNPAQTILFPEMDARVDVPEITTDCWNILDVHPDSMMCATSRMVVRRKGAGKASVLACTLLWDDPQFELADSFGESRKSVQLNHPHCAKFCVLGGASCSA